MTTGELTTRTLELCGEDSAAPVFYTAAMARSALNEAQRIFAVLTLCQETTAAFPLSADTTWYDMRTAHPGVLAPLWVSYGGRKLRPRSLNELDALNETWQSTTGTPESYCYIGATGLLATYPQIDSDGNSITFVGATEPPVLLSDSDVPEIPTEHHESLIDYAVPRLRATEGGNEMMGELWRLDRFLVAVEALGNYTRGRALSKRYDVQPFEMARFDRAAFLADIVKNAKRGAK